MAGVTLSICNGTQPHVYRCGCHKGVLLWGLVGKEIQLVRCPYGDCIPHLGRQTHVYRVGAIGVCRDGDWVPAQFSGWSDTANVQWPTGPMGIGLGATGCAAMCIGAAI